jgi:hypothetical protein
MRAKMQVTLLLGASLAMLLSLASVLRADVSRFVGSYTGSAEVVSADGTKQPRDMSVTIDTTKEGFRVSWTSTTYRANGSAKVKSYTIDFAPSERDGVYAAAMRRNVFGHDVQLDPMKGEPYVWSRILGDTLSVYSIYVTEEGGYEIQQFDRTLAPGGLMLEFQNVRDGDILRTVSTFLERQ